MSDMMTFPNTVEEFMEQYKIVDTEKIYTNGAELVPIFRMKQWFEHLSSTDTISRQAAIDALNDMPTSYDEYEDALMINRGKAVLKIEQLPPVTPKRRTGKWLWQTGKIRCNQCLIAIRRIDHDGLLNFCPNCGTTKTVRLKINEYATFFDVDKAEEKVVEAWNRRVTE